MTFQIWYVFAFKPQIVTGKINDFHFSHNHWPPHRVTTIRFDANKSIHLWFLVDDFVHEKNIDYQLSKMAAPLNDARKTFIFWCNFSSIFTTRTENTHDKNHRRTDDQVIRDIFQFVRRFQMLVKSQKILVEKNWQMGKRTHSIAAVNWSLAILPKHVHGGPDELIATFFSGIFFPFISFFFNEFFVIRLQALSRPQVRK